MNRRTCRSRANHPTSRRPTTLVDAARTLHLIDIDNLLGDPTTTDRSLICRLFADYRQVAGHEQGDHVVVATGRNAAHVLEVELAWSAAQHRRRSGADGADLVLLEEARWAAGSGRYQRVVLGSGDHIFVGAVEALRAAGVTVEVVTGRGGLSRMLALCAGDAVRLLPDRQLALAS